MTNKKKKKNYTSTIFTIAFFVFILFEILPVTKPLRDSNMFLLIIKSAFSVAILYFMWFDKNKPPLFEKVVLSVYALTPWLVLFISARIVILLEIIIFYILVVRVLTFYFKRQKYSQTVICLMAFIILMMLLDMDNFTFINNDGDLHFWQLSVITAIIATIATIILITKKILFFDEKQKFYRYSAPLFVFVVAFMMSWTSINDLNYALDYSKPTLNVGMITDKKVTRTSKNYRRYILIVSVNGGEKEFYVDDTEYDDRKIGDFMRITLYKGAFNDPYYHYDY